mmetsp:Transcript_22386/g.29973  ORF Transcript_22386/g.29973 Transcript_22386/m.29973 type:complete len:83 (-) Transcript_22386:590-838(-)
MQLLRAVLHWAREQRAKLFIRHVVVSWVVFLLLLLLSLEYIPRATHFDRVMLVPASATATTEEAFDRMKIDLWAYGFNSFTE